MSDFNDPPQFQPPSFQPPQPPAPPAAPSWEAFPASGPPTTPIEVGQQPAPKRKRSKGVLIGAGVAVVALVAAGVFAITQIGGSDEQGGAKSSTEAGENLIKALNDEDVLGAVDLLLPGERETFRQPMIDLVDNLKRIEVLGSDADPSKVGGIDIDLTDVKVTADKPVADDIATINIAATNKSTANGKDIPIGDILVKNVFGGEQPDASTSDTAQADDVNLSLTTVEKDGRWYVSLFYTIAESVRLDKAASKPVPDEGIALVGADQPEDAVDQMVVAVTKLDLPSIIGGLNPNEAEALQRYAPIFLDRADARADDLGVEVTYRDATYIVTGSGDHRHVTIASFKLTIGADDQEATVEVKDGCAVITTGDRTVDTCEGGKDITKAFDDAGLGDDATPEVELLVTTMQDAFSDFEGTGIAVDRIDEKWYVSPMGTGTDFLNAVLSALDKDEITDIIDKAKAVVTSFDNGEISLPGLGGTPSDASIPANTTVTTTEDTTFATTVTTTDDTTSASTATTTDDTTVDSGSGASVSAATFQSETERFIEGPEVAGETGKEFTDAACETPTSTEVGTTYSCTADDADGASYVFTVRIDTGSTFIVEDVNPA